MKISFLSIVIPVYNEEKVLVELVARCQRAAGQLGFPYEIILVDDASFDRTADIMSELSRDARIRAVRLPENKGQFTATREGVVRARGDWIVVLDGDLQDPPETIPVLANALGADAREHTVVFAVKRKRAGSFWFNAGNSLYRFIVSLLSKSFPSGAGSFCLFSRSFLKSIDSVSCRNVNLSAVLMASGACPRTVMYEKSVRYDRSSRVGMAGLIHEALVSCFMLSPFGRKRAQRKR
jgi:dolichol-phosphate mannosyltransferase